MFVTLKSRISTPLLRIATGLHFESLFCAVVKVQRVPRFSRLRRMWGSLFSVCFQTLKTIQNSSLSQSANIQQHSVDAVRLVNPRLPSLTRLATLSRCFAALQQLLTDEFASFPSLPLPIDQ